MVVANSVVLNAHSPNLMANSEHHITFYCVRVSNK